MNEETRSELLELANSKMQFGKYAGRYLIDLPEHYLVWYRTKGFPKNKLGAELFRNLYVVSGAEHPYDGQKPSALNINELK